MKGMSAPHSLGSGHLAPESTRVLWPRVAAVAAIVLTVSIGWASRGACEGAPELGRAEAWDAGPEPDARTRGLGDSTPTTRVTSEGFPVVVDAKVIAEELPEEPLPRQRRAPCRGNSVEINGGCWMVTNIQPPCGDDAYEWKGSCYYPIIVTRAKPRTSKKR
jgi:eukaryotic-like serine/threonine-protein kinase